MKEMDGIDGMDTYELIAYNKIKQTQNMIQDSEYERISSNEYKKDIEISLQVIENHINSPFFTINRFYVHKLSDLEKRYEGILHTVFRNRGYNTEADIDSEGKWIIRIIKPKV